MYAIPVLGYIPMPTDFRHSSACLTGRPRHSKNDLFFHRHPAMGLTQRAKIFAPFDALRGFSDEIASRETIYEKKHIPGDDEEGELNDMLRMLADLTRSSREAKKNSVIVTITYFVPVGDNTDRGLYQIVTGMCLGISLGIIRILIKGKEKAIRLNDIVDIETGNEQALK